VTENIAFAGMLYVCIFGGLALVSGFLFMLLVLYCRFSRGDNDCLIPPGVLLAFATVAFVVVAGVNIERWANPGGSRDCQDCKEAFEEGLKARVIVEENIAESQEVQR
jgi:hypothetical protein